MDYGTIFGSVKAIAESAKDLHSSDNGNRIELFIFIWVVVKRFTKPISAAVQSLAAGQQTSLVQITKNTEKIKEHDAKIENHETRIGELETDVNKLKTKP